MPSSWCSSFLSDDKYGLSSFVKSCPAETTSCQGTFRPSLRKKHSKPSRLNVGDWVRIRRPFSLHKLETRLTHPRRISQLLGKETVQLEDDSRWNTAQCIPARSPAPSQQCHLDSESDAICAAAPGPRQYELPRSEAPVSVRRYPVREKRSPDRCGFAIYDWQSWCPPKGKMLHMFCLFVVWQFLNDV